MPPPPPLLMGGGGGGENLGECNSSSRSWQAVDPRAYIPTMFGYTLRRKASAWGTPGPRLMGPRRGLAKAIAPAAWRLQVGTKGACRGRGVVDTCWLNPVILNANKSSATGKKGATQDHCLHILEARTFPDGQVTTTTTMHQVRV